MPLPRSDFDDSQGALLVEQVATSETQLDPHGPGLKTSLYLAFGAAGALLKYVEESECIVPLASSLHVELIGTGRYKDPNQDAPYCHS